MRLNDDIRGRIITAICHATFADRKARRNEADHALAKRVRDTQLTPAMIKTVDSLPVKFMSGNTTRFGATTARYVYVRNGQGEEPSSSYEELHFHADLPVPSHLVGKTVLIDDAQLWADIVEWVANRKTLAEQIDALCQESKGVLNAYSSSDKLLVAWPSIKDVMPAGYFDPPIKPSLPIALANNLDGRLKAVLSLAA